MCTLQGKFRRGKVTNFSENVSTFHRQICRP